ncbi:inner membrane protein YiaA [Xanthomonas campestris]|uniref:inner membrane protein YiaA n=1 Tax=Xanthomonas campestris TaxID=339 RepID=UPI002B1CC922|nr:inner membrane protein YiaA [Xanthomonas campestris]
MAATQKTSPAFIAASWAALLLGSAAYLIGLWNAQMMLNEKGYYFTLLLFGLFASVSLQKSVRDRADGIPVTGLYYAICWFSLIIALLLLAIGLINATLLLSEKGFYAMAYALSLFGAVAVQKNTRDAMDVDNASHPVRAVPPPLD